MLIDRDITPTLLEAAAQSPAITLTGPRQSGKTTLCRAVFQQHAYVTLEAPDERAFAIVSRYGQSEPSAPREARHIHTHRARRPLLRACDRKTGHVRPRRRPLENPGVCGVELGPISTGSLSLSCADAHEISKTLSTITSTSSCRGANPNNQSPTSRWHPSPGCNGAPPQRTEHADTTSQDRLF